ncbi:alpha/beta hydrolase [Acidisoma cellulosilytica]|uniref:Alpha/beta hydrolase n=1 Tax=Acidisoma cellulosilyticum TaxID=2802395 RepID=A0A963YYJ7_9PROT|nr:alpha/beta hydrolase [Acidisoma cellulosilyticum]MCB8878615.1 alpha/beta hydrolase [Acidisoma cellulosilyticum]
MADRPIATEHRIAREQGSLYARDYPSSGPAFVLMAAEFYAEHARNAGHLAELKELDVPVKLIWGALDPYITVAVAEKRQVQLKTASLTVLPAGHWLQIDDPEGVAKAMLS